MYYLIISRAFLFLTEKLTVKPSAKLSSHYFSVCVALFFVGFFNASFFGSILNLAVHPGVRDVVFTVNAALLLLALNYIFISIIALPYVAKPLLSIMFFVAAGVAYFMDSYGIVIHRLMIQNMMETDLFEVEGLINKTLIFYLFALGLLPALMLSKITITFDTFGKELWKKTKHIGIAVVCILMLIMSMSQDYASFFRNHKSVRQLANPLNFVYAGFSYFTTSNHSIAVEPIENDAAVSAFGKAQIKPTLFILVVGETARADHFGINGYERDTTPLLSQQNIINFTDVASCGTETAVSVPCMFSALGRSNYSDSKAKSQEGLLDVISHAGIPVLWRDNNSSCKGTCNRVAYEDVQHLNIPDLCNEHECFDEILLHHLNGKMSATTGSQFIVLHQKGSHGPDYYNRYPKNREHFAPVCQDSQLQNCTKEQLVNTFDNTIRYTDYFLNSTIGWLKTKDKQYNTSLLYLSDHGESLGEKNLYLHGMPYAFAPKEQKRIPFFLWMSTGFEQVNAIDTECLKKMSGAPYSHDNLFHTVLGMLNINSGVYKTQLDMVQPCRASTQSRMISNKNLQSLPLTFHSTARSPPAYDYVSTTLIIRGLQHDA